MLPSRCSVAHRVPVMASSPLKLCSGWGWGTWFPEQKFLRVAGLEMLGAELCLPLHGFCPLCSRAAPLGWL